MYICRYRQVTLFNNRKLKLQPANKFIYNKINTSTYILMNLRVLFSSQYIDEIFQTNQSWPLIITSVITLIGAYPLTARYGRTVATSLKRSTCRHYQTCFICIIFQFGFLCFFHSLLLPGRLCSSTRRVRTPASQTTQLNRVYIRKNSRIRCSNKMLLVLLLNKVGTEIFLTPINFL